MDFSTNQLLNLWQKAKSEQTALNKPQKKNSHPLRLRLRLFILQSAGISRSPNFLPSVTRLLTGIDGYQKKERKNCSLLMTRDFYHQATDNASPFTQIFKVAQYQCWNRIMQQQQRSSAWIFSLKDALCSKCEIFCLSSVNQ